MSTIKLTGEYHADVNALTTRLDELQDQIRRRDMLLLELGCPFDPVSDLYPTEVAPAVSCDHTWLGNSKTGRIFCANCRAPHPSQA